VRTAETRRRATYARGLSAETVALGLLMLKGYRPLARRFSAAGGDAVAFVEVKARGVMDDALASIDATKRRRFSRAARAWLARHPWAVHKTLRADAVFVAPRRWPRHLVSAFELEM
jgi:putative endonuclease